MNILISKGTNVQSLLTCTRTSYPKTGKAKTELPLPLRGFVVILTEFLKGGVENLPRRE